MLNQFSFGKAGDSNPPPPDPLWIRHRIDFDFNRFCLFVVDMITVIDYFFNVSFEIFYDTGAIILMEIPLDLKYT